MAHVSTHLELSPRDWQVLVQLVEGHQTLEDVTRWALTASPPKLFRDAQLTSGAPDPHQPTRKPCPGFDIVIQDEYTHDVVVPYGTGSCGTPIFLVYDTT